MSNLSKNDRLRAGLIKLVGVENCVHRERDMTLRDDKGKLSRDRVAEHTIKLLEEHLAKDCTDLEIGVSAFGKKASVVVDPKNMIDLSRVSRAAAVVASNPTLMVKDEVTSISADYTRKACGIIVANNIGATVGNDDIGNMLIIAAAVSGKYGWALQRELLGPDEVEEPSPKTPKVKTPKVKTPKVKTPKVKTPKANIEPFVNDGAAAPAIVS